jgi:predicted aspartyl protease
MAILATAISALPATAMTASASPAASPCQLLQVAELQVTLLENAPLIPASIDGHVVQMLVDTGAAKSLIWRSAAQELKLNLQASDTTFYGVGGSDAAGLVWVKEFGLAGATVRNLHLYAVGRGTLPGNSAGILGEDLLAKWDIEFDLAKGKLRLFVPKNCNGDQVVYWAPSYFMMNLIPPPGQSNWLEGNVRLNGHEVVAMFDTGAASSTVTSQALQRSGIKAESPVADAGATHGLAARPIDTAIAVFPSLSIGQETVDNVQLRVADLFGKNTAVRTGSYIARAVVNNPDMLIGADFFLAHRVYVARSQGKIYFTYNGGPIFRRLRPDGDAGAGDPREK